MKWFLILITLFFLLRDPFNAHAQQNLKDQYIVVLKEGAPSDITSSQGITPERIYQKIFNGFSARLNTKALNGLLKNPRVQEIIQDKILKLELPLPSYVQSSPTWGIDRIDQRKGPLDSKYMYEYTGSGVNAYVIDTGINFYHEEFEGRAVPGFDAFSDGKNGSDCQGHGTHVAGTIGSKTFGVAKGVKLISVRVLDCSGSGSLSGVLAGLDWIGINNSGPAVANMSLGSSKNTTLNEAVKKLFSLNINVVVAGGNSNGDACNYSPSSATEAITVGATDETDKRATFSNYGNCLDLFAPGVNITSTWFSSPTASAVLSGTSMASPHVAGVASLYLQENPQLDSYQLTEAMKNSSTKFAVLNANSLASHLIYSFNDGVPETIPLAPGSLVATYLDRKGINLTWKDQSQNEDGFEIYRSTNMGSFVSLAKVNAQTTSFLDQNVTQGNVYSYRIMAFNSAGFSDFSNSSTVKIDGKTSGRRK
jgi:subtilisin family serine protease